MAGVVAIAAACGGQTGGLGSGDGGSDGSSGSSGSGSGGSSGGSSGSSSGGTTCAPLPGCASSLECPSPDGCGVCYCEGSEWECSGTGCSDAFPIEDAPSACTPFAPFNGTVCSDIGAQCYYPSDGGCGGDACYCQPSGTWLCEQGECVDSGPPPFEGGFFDSPDSCPENQPHDNAPCSDQGNICSYFTSCETNCLCASSGWVCATQQDCGDF